jgi:hypothetical protein
LSVATFILEFLQKHNGAAPDPPGAPEASRSFWKERTPPAPGLNLRWFLFYGEGTMHAAEAAAARWRAGRPLSVIDGVPFAVKDNLATVEYPTCLGTSFYHRLCAPLVSYIPMILSIKYLYCCTRGQLPTNCNWVLWPRMLCAHILYLLHYQRTAIVR